MKRLRVWFIGWLQQERLAMARQRIQALEVQNDKLDALARQMQAKAESRAAECRVLQRELDDLDRACAERSAKIKRKTHKAKAAAIPKVTQ